MISKYLLSIVGISFVSILVEISLPNGKMNGFVKGVFGVFILFCIVSPIANIDGIKTNIDTMIENSSAVKIDEDFLIATNKQMIEQQESVLETKLCDGGFAGVKVSIEYTIKDLNTTINRVVLNLKNLKINTNILHKNKYEEMRDICVEYLKIDGELICFYE